LNKFEKSFQMLFITDQKSVINCTLSLRLAFNLVKNDGKSMEEYATLVKLAFYLTDKLANFKLSSTVIFFVLRFLAIFSLLI